MSRNRRINKLGGVMLLLSIDMCFINILVNPQEEMSGESVVSSAVPAATTRTTSFKGSSPSSKYVKLNVGGALYYTTMQTLTKQDTMLKAMFSGRMEVLTDSEGESCFQDPAVGSCM